MRRCRLARPPAHQELCWLIEHTPPGAARTQLEALLAPLEALLARYPAPSTGDTGVVEEEQAPASTAAPSAS